MSDNDTVRFLLNGTVHNATGVDPSVAVLQYLRDWVGLNGTKEGCAEGDCGACTSALFELDINGGLRLNPVNTCIRLLPSLDGKALYTVEGLAEGQDLHPVQRALVSCHGAQCGFCTPGFVMSLFVLFKNANSPSREQINDALSGNLCRCTGYRPIIDAAREMYEDASSAADGRWLDVPHDNGPISSELIERLRAIHRTTHLDIQGPAKRFVAPRTIEELSHLVVHHPSATLMAGGTDLGPKITAGIDQIGDIIFSTREVAGLNRVTRSDQSVEIGAAVSIADAFDALEPDYPELASLKRRFGGPGIRASATLAGNLANASPVADSAPSLIALGATVVLLREQDERELPLEEFFVDFHLTALQAGEFIKSIRVPRRSSSAVFQTYKVAKRFDQDIATVSAAFQLQMSSDRVSDARLAFGGVAVIPRRASTAEDALRGQPWNQATLERAVAMLEAEFSPTTDVRAGRTYRHVLTGNLLRRFFAETTTSGLTSIWQHKAQW